MIDVVSPARSQEADRQTPSSPVFTRIQIQTVSWCNRSCVFCPSGKFPVPRTFMLRETFERVIAQLQALDFRGRISPYLMNEPLLDKRLPDLIALTRTRCPGSWIAINTNGDALSEQLAHRLFAAGLNCLDVNAYDSPDQHAVHVHLATKVAAQRQDVICRTGYLDPSFDDLTLPRTTKIFHCRDMSDWDPRFRAAEVIPHLTNRAGNVPQTHPVPAPLALGCERPFQQMYINYRGEAVLCCNDWRFEVVMGDTAASPLAEIWINDAYHAYRRHLQQQDRSLPLCATCDYPGK